MRASSRNRSLAILLVVSALGLVPSPVPACNLFCGCVGAYSWEPDQHGAGGRFLRLDRPGDDRELGAFPLDRSHESGGPTGGWRSTSLLSETLGLAMNETARPALIAHEGLWQTEGSPEAEMGASAGTAAPEFRGSTADRIGAIAGRSAGASVTVVPEPSTATLTLLALLAVLTLGGWQARARR